MKRLLVFVLISIIIFGTMACQRTDSKSESGASPDKSYTNTSEDEKDVKSENDSTESAGAENNNAEDVKDSKENGVEEKEATLYFGDSDALKLVGEKRILKSITPEVLIEELIKGPQDSNNSKTIPDGTKLLTVEVKDKIAYVNFSKELKDNHWGGSTGEIFTIFSIVNTLVLQPDLDIERVQILIEGQAIDTLAGHADISVPLEPDLEIVDMK